VGIASQQAYAGTAKGQLTVNDDTIELQHAYATAQPGFFDETKEDIVVFVSNVTLSDEAVPDMWERHKVDKYVEVSIDADQQPISVKVNHPAFQASPSGTSTTFILELSTFDEKTVAGRFYSETEQEFFGTTYTFDFTFQAEIQRKAELPPATEEEKEAAANSPQAAVFLEYITAAHASDVDALKTLVAGELAQELDGPDQEDILEFLKMFTPKEVEFQRIVKEEGDSATLIANAQAEGATSKGTLDFVKEGGTWRLLKASWESDATSSGGSEEIVAETPEDKLFFTAMDMRNIGVIIDSYKDDRDLFPVCPSEKDLSEVEAEGLDEAYYVDWGYEGDFKDYWGTPFKYVSTPDGKEFKLISYGADQVKGGTGEFDADIVLIGTIETSVQFVAPPNVVEEYNF
jgi:hypothetical protein